MEVKYKLLKILNLILFFVILFGGIYAYVTYKENVTIKVEKVELTNKIEELEKEVEDYKSKLQTISDILNTALDTTVENETKTEEDSLTVDELSDSETDDFTIIDEENLEVNGAQLEKVEE